MMVALAAVAISVPAYGQVTVIFTRHAEKAATPADRPAAHERRAEARRSCWPPCWPNPASDAIYVTEFQRTQQTAAPLAARVHVKPTVIPARTPRRLVKAIRARHSGVVVVVGHSNKLPRNHLRPRWTKG